MRQQWVVHGSGSASHDVQHNVTYVLQQTKTQKFDITFQINTIAKSRTLQTAQR